MKKLAALTISLIATLPASVFTAVPAYAEDSAVTVYPEDFTRQVSFEGVNDYAVGEGKLAVLKSGNIFEYTGKSENKLSVESKNAFAVYYSGDDSLCYENQDGIFKYSDDSTAIVEKTVPFTVDNFLYDVNPSTGVITVVNRTDYSTTEFPEYTNLKKCRGKAYAMKEGVLYEINGTAATGFAYEYLDFSTTETVATGNTPDILKTFSAEAPCFITLKDGEYVTETDVTALTERYFQVGKTFPVSAESVLKPETKALLLCRTGNADLFTSDGKCYIKLSGEPFEKRVGAIKPAGFETATVSVAESYAYSSPFVSKGTQLYKLTAGARVKVLGKLTKTDCPEIMRDFYKITPLNGDGSQAVGEDGQAIVGYVPFGYVSQYNYQENDPVKYPDPEYDASSLTRTVVLILIVVVLVMIAAGYLIFIATSGRKKRDKKRGDKKE